MNDTRTEEPDRALGMFVRRLAVAVVALIIAAFGASWAARIGWELAERKSTRSVRIEPWNADGVVIPEGAHWQIVERDNGAPFLVIAREW